MHAPTLACTHPRDQEYMLYDMSSTLVVALYASPHHARCGGLEELWKHGVVPQQCWDRSGEADRVHEDHSAKSAGNPVFGT